MPLVTYPVWYDCWTRLPSQAPLSHDVFMTSLVISLVAAFISAVSLGISYLSYQRDRPHVIATINRERHGSGEGASYLLHIRLINSGAKAIQIDTRRFESERQPGREWGISQEEVTGPALPSILSGYSSFYWWMDIRNVMSGANYERDKIRSTISLGSGKVVKSSWITPTVADEIEVQAALDKQMSIPPESVSPTVVWR
jgi:hypothetical protein